MASVHGGRLVAQALKRHGISHVFTLCGGHIQAIYDGCLDEGIRIIDVRGRRVGVVAAAIRTALILLVIPPLVFTREGRGLHDLATSTAAVRGPDRG